MKTQREVERLMEKYQMAQNQSPDRRPLSDSINQFMERIANSSFKDQEKSVQEESVKQIPSPKRFAKNSKQNSRLVNDENCEQSMS